jgi:hypothetical protein
MISKAPQSPIKPLNDADCVPRRALGLEPAIAGDGDIDVALAEMSYLQSRAETAKQARDKAIELAKATYAAKMRVNVHGKGLDLGDRFMALYRVALDYAGRTPFFAEGQRSRDFAHGSIGFKSAPLKLAFAPGKDEDSVLAAIDQRTGLWNKTLELLGSVLYALPLRELVRVKREPNIAGAKAAYKEGRVKVEDLEKLGYQMLGGHQALSVSVNAWAPPPPTGGSGALQSQSAKATQNTLL